VDSARPRLPGNAASGARLSSSALRRCRGGSDGNGRCAMTSGPSRPESTKTRPATTECRLVSWFLHGTRAASLALLGIGILARAVGQRLFANAHDDAPPAPQKRDVAAGIARWRRTESGWQPNSLRPSGC
jgi:hypothetical protein